ncbi:ATP-binding protein [Candidatus Phytoplasma prunorum]|uniref:ATP-binding protein n=1 Tax=Candidatus Phytoplasma prunorum TaxID=47565 RepID=UPI002FF02FB1
MAVNLTNPKDIINKKLKKIMTENQNQQNFKKIMLKTILKNSQTKAFYEQGLIQTEADYNQIYTFLTQLKHQSFPDKSYYDLVYDNHYGFQIKKVIPTVTKQLRFRELIKKNHQIFETNLFFNDVDLTTFNDGGCAIKKQAQQFLQTSLNAYRQKTIHDNPNVFISGGFKTSKSFLFKALANTLIKNQINFLYLFMPDLVRQFSNNYADYQVLKEKFTILKNVPYLILDDFGFAEINQKFRNYYFYPLLKTRLEMQYPTGVSTNYDVLNIDKVLEITTDTRSSLIANKIAFIFRQYQIFDFGLNFYHE